MIYSLYYSWKITTYSFLLFVKEPWDKFYWKEDTGKGWSDQKKIQFLEIHYHILDFPGVSVVKNPPAIAGDARDVGLIHGLGRSLGEGNGNPTQYSCLENPMDRGVWRSRDHGAAKSQTRLSTHVHHIYMISNVQYPVYYIYIYYFTLLLGTAFWVLLRDFDEYVSNSHFITWKCCHTSQKSFII